MHTVGIVYMCVNTVYIYLLMCTMPSPARTHCNA